MARKLRKYTKQDGLDEEVENKHCWMVWPEGPDNTSGREPVTAFVEVAKAISKFEQGTMVVSKAQYDNTRYML